MEWPLPESRPVEIESLEQIQDIGEHDFLSRAGEFAAKSPSALLLSGGEPRPQGENRYSIAASEPFAVLASKGDRCRIEACGQVFELRANPLDVLDRLGASFAPSFGLETPPFSGGAVGYLAYDLKNMIERLPASAADDLGLPDLFMFWPRRIMVHDRKEKRLFQLLLKLKGERYPTHGLQYGSPARASASPLRTGPLASNFSHEDYLAAVGKVRQYIRRGDVYQVNLSQRFHFDLDGDPFQLWLALFEMNPAPFYAYINAGDHQVLSTSMERFLFRENKFIETRPIKGTRKRGKTPDEDAALAVELLQSRKDDAELSMIVDLLRNDLGRVCLPRTIRVSEHKRLETYQNVHHLVSIVTGDLEPGITPGRIVRGTFPGGSVTGCPKIRSMEIIDELEPNVRHVYTGSIGYLGWHDNMDLNIAIRTAIVKGKTCYFSVGGGIVYDSDEEDEYRETLHKGRTLFELIEKLGESASPRLPPRKTVWLNGSFLPSDEACVSPLDRGFLYGDGFFETIRARDGRPLYLREHLERLYASLSAFHIALAPPVPEWAQIIESLLRQNGLVRGAASIKILVSRGIEPSPGLPSIVRPTVCVFANGYVPPPPEEYEKGWGLHILTEGFSPPLAAHKSLNYLYFMAARQAALDCGRREAVLLDRDGNVSETSAGSLLARTGGRWWTPQSACQLPGITIRTVCSILLDAGDEVENRPAGPDDLLAAQTVWVLNSLIGIMPAAQIDGRPVSDPACADAARLRDLLFSRG